jgi:hypothetical protein
MFPVLLKLSDRADRPSLAEDSPIGSATARVRFELAAKNNASNAPNGPAS